MAGAVLQVYTDLYKLTSVGRSDGTQIVVFTVLLCTYIGLLNPIAPAHDACTVAFRRLDLVGRFDGTQIVFACCTSSGIQDMYALMY